jgi:hypothetical protein
MAPFFSTLSFAHNSPLSFSTWEVGKFFKALFRC